MTTAHHDKQSNAAPHPRDAGPRFARRHRADSPRLSVSADELARLLQSRTANKGPNMNLPAWGAGIGATLAAVFSVMTWLNASTQDKVDKGTAPLNMQISEMDKRIAGRFDTLDKTVDKSATRLDAIDGRLGTIEMRLERIDSKLK